VTQASDVYAFGMLWWEICTGQRVWPSLGTDAIKKRVLAKEVPNMPDDYSQGFKVPPYPTPNKHHHRLQPGKGGMRMQAAK
jgi:hypothetical protein